MIAFRQNEVVINLTLIRNKVDLSNLRKTRSKDLVLDPYLI